MCESCGACREIRWSACPFCGAHLAAGEVTTSDDHGRFDAMAAVAETSDSDLLPSPVPVEEEEPEAADDFITAQDLAHLTGDGGPAVNGWDSPSPPAPAPEPVTSDGIDAPVSKAVVFPLLAFAVVAVVFVVYSIATASPTIRPDAVALIDGPTTTIAPVTTTEAPAFEAGVVGVDLAEQATWLCSGDQFSIARAEAPSLAVYNDLLTATRDGRDDWTAPADHVTLRNPVPSLIGCLTTADGGEIDRCPVNGYTISRRSVTWSYRVLRSTDGLELGSDSGTAAELQPCDDLVIAAEGDDMASWSELPQDRLDQVAAAYTTAPHPQVACATENAEDLAVRAADSLDADGAPTALLEGLALDATIDGITNSTVSLPDGWSAAEDRPVQAVLCLSMVDVEPESSADAEDRAKNEAASAPEPDSCATTIRVTAQHRDGEPLGSWDYTTATCSSADETVTPPDKWWIDVVGPDLGYVLESGGE